MAGERPENPTAHLIAAVALLDVNGGKQALAYADEAVGLAPDSAKAHMIRAEALHRRGKVKDARASASRAVELAPHDPASHHPGSFHPLVHVFVHAKERDGSHAECALDWAIKDNPEDA
jgi:predicted Zn-dependent protease